MADYHARSREQLVEFLEELSGRSLRTRAELESYLSELKARTDAPAPRPRHWTIAKHALLAAGLLIAVLQFYLIDIYVEIASMQRVQFLNPADSPLIRSALQVLRQFC